MKSSILIYEIGLYLSWFTVLVKMENKNGRFDISIHAESFLIPILNKVFKCEFIRLEYVQHNHPAVDLGNKKNKIAIQVTSEKGFDKISYTISSFIKHRLFNDYSNLYHLVIDESYETSKTNEDIIAIIRKVSKAAGLKKSPKIEFDIKSNIILL